MSCWVGHRCGLNMVLLWRGPAAIALIQPLAWEPPYAVGVSLKKKNLLLDTLLMHSDKPRWKFVSQDL